MSLLVHHTTSIVIEAPSAHSFRFMADPANLGAWAFNNGRVDETGLASGTSRYDGSSVFARIDADPGRLIVDYHVGSKADHLSPRIMAKVIEGPLLDLRDNQSGLSLLAWRSRAMDDLRWWQLEAAHEMEILMLKNLIEAAL